MSEYQPQESSEIQFTLGNKEFSFTPEDLPRAFTHDDPTYDHFLYVNSWKNGKPQTALLFFRELFETHGIDVEELFEFFAEEEVDFIPQGEPPELDLTLYAHWQKTNKKLPLVIKLVPDEVEHNEYVEEPKEPTIPFPEEEWSPRKNEQAEKWGAFVAHLAEQIANGERSE